MVAHSGITHRGVAVQACGGASTIPSHRAADTPPHTHSIMSAAFDYLQHQQPARQLRDDPPEMPRQPCLRVGGCRVRTALRYQRIRAEPEALACAVQSTRKAPSTTRVSRKGATASIHSRRTHPLSCTTRHLHLTHSSRPHPTAVSTMPQGASSRAADAATPPRAPLYSVGELWGVTALTMLAGAKAPSL